MGTRTLNPLILFLGMAIVFGHENDVFGHENDRSVQDTFMKKCKKKVQFIEEQDLWVNGCFMSEEDMRLDKFSE